MIAFVLHCAAWLGAAFLAGAVLSAPASAAGCEAWKGGSEIRCLSQNPDLVSAIAQTVHVQNVSGVVMTFRYEQWDSSCGLPGGSKGGPAAAVLQPGGSMEVVLNSAAFGGGLGGARCTELFFFSCTAGGQGSRCSDGLSTRMDAARSDIFGLGIPFRGLGQ